MSIVLLIPVILLAIAAGTYLGIRSGRRAAEDRRAHEQQQDAGADLVADFIGGDLANMTLTEIGEALIRQGVTPRDIADRAKFEALITARYLTPEDREWLSARGWKDPQR